MKCIIGIVGEMASGKTTVTTYLEENYNATSFRFSTVLKDILERLHLDSKREHFQKLSTALRQTFGDDTLSKVLAKDVAATGSDIVVVEGIRRPDDIRYLKEMPGFHLVALNVDERTRYERVTSRQEKADDQTKKWEEFQKEGQQESEQKITEIKKAAEFVIDNNGSLDATFAQIDDIITQYSA